MIVLTLIQVFKQTLINNHLVFFFLGFDPSSLAFLLEPSIASVFKVSCTRSEKEGMSEFSWALACCNFNAFLFFNSSWDFFFFFFDFVLTFPFSSPGLAL